MKFDLIKQNPLLFKYSHLGQSQLTLFELATLFCTFIPYLRHRKRLID